ncbi:THUMP domain-containing protein 1 [Culex quinquefasciatus]|uniref:THUMP domain-containing protein 1 n=1 Tax=Culex quinquefasciatus TaxID=7176 RepID=B0X733_CULQU|nr:THUMP domain-containing protein 1 [Culex quinquefasciatus]|eukprot:XP_001865455.1 THUMP domain-containing protein 1 [Culex quinquefasciatus]
MFDLFLLSAVPKKISSRFFCEFTVYDKRISVTCKTENGTAPGTRSGWADDLYGRVGESPPKKQPVEGGAEANKEDISVQVQKQVEAAKTEKKKFRLNGVTTMLEDPTELVLKILRDAAETNKQKSRYIRKPVPIEVVTKANLKDIMGGAGKLFDRYFLKEPKTFAMIFNRRFNNGLERESRINALAEMISAKNRDNKTNLMHSELAVIVDVIKGNRAGVFRAAGIDRVGGAEREGVWQEGGC